MIHVDSNIHDDDGLLTTAQAAKLLGVRKETLYAYVSRKIIPRYGGPRSRGSLFARSDVERLIARRDARAGHAAVAAGALRWGEPVLDTELCLIDPARGPAYRGRSALALAADGASFEAVAEWLWCGDWKPDARWAPTPLDVGPVASGAIVHRLMATVLASARDLRAAPPLAEPAELAAARRLIRSLGACLRPDAAGAAGRVAEMVARSLGVASTRRHVAAIDAALVLLADHELNASAFAARVAASTGATLHDCVLAALATGAGPRHGTASERVAAIAREIGEPRRARAELRRRLARGDDLPGFGHPLYPEGDPRARALSKIAARLSTRSREARVVRAMASAVRALGGPLPNVDLGLAELAAALGAPNGGPFLFLVGRSAGWIAHALEQRRAAFILRPRARYVGPAPEP